MNVPVRGVRNIRVFGLQSEIVWEACSMPGEKLSSRLNGPRFRFFGLFALRLFEKSMQMEAKKGRKNAISELLDWKSVFSPLRQASKPHKSP
jgi:hypothetical protein